MVDTFNTMYDTVGHRRLGKGDVERSAFATTFYDDRIVCTLDLDWSLYPARLPRDGDVWEFESARWGAAGGQCWNGMESIHGRSTWGALRFSLTERQRLAIVRRQVFAAYADYRREDTAWRHEGCLRHWTDEDKMTKTALAALPAFLTMDCPSTWMRTKRLKTSRQIEKICQNFCRCFPSEDEQHEGKESNHEETHHCSRCRGGYAGRFCRTASPRAGAWSGRFSPSAAARRAAHVRLSPSAAARHAAHVRLSPSASPSSVPPSSWWRVGTWRAELLAWICGRRHWRCRDAGDC